MALLLLHNQKREVVEMHFIEYERKLKVVLIKAYRKELSLEEAVAQAESILAQLGNDVAEAKKRVGDVMPHLCDGSIVVNEAQEGILCGE